MNRIASAALAAAVVLAPLGVRAAPADEMTRKERIEKRAEMMTKRFTRLDADKDGALTRAESVAPAAKAFDRFDANSDGVIDEAETKAHADKMKARMAKRGGDETKTAKRAGRFERADADKDGKVTRAEFLARSAPWFARADADKNDTLTKDELAALTEKMRTRAARKAEKPAN